MYNVYLDHFSTTPCDPQVVEAMLPYFSENFGNTASQHAAGRRANHAVEEARTQIANLIGAVKEEIIFTSGSTESDNLALFGVVRAHKGSRRKIITLTTEHKAILNACGQLEREGFEVVCVGVDKKGRVDLDTIATNVDENTLLVSVHLANNEVGTIQPLRAIADIAHRHGALLHSDATQAVGKIVVNVDDLDVDLMSVSAHKFYGPKGVGALFVRGGPRAIPLAPIGYGGGQEWSLRSGTHNVPGIVGFGKAASIALAVLDTEMARVCALRDSLEARLISTMVGLSVNGDSLNRLPGSSSISFAEVDAEALMANVPELMLSTGAACNTGAPEPSHVLLAMGLSRDLAYSTIRFGLGRFNTPEEIGLATNLISAAYSRLKGMNA